MAELEEEFPMYISKEVPFVWKSLEEINSDAVIFSDGSTKFKQGQLGDCWLTAAIESIRQKFNQESLREIASNSSNLEFRFWQNGEYQTVTLKHDSLPTENGDLVFMHNFEGSEYWGALLEKAYAKWIGSYEGLNGGFWTDAMQSFTGGVVERIKFKEGIPDNLYDIMLNTYNKGSFLCCIKKNVPDNEMNEKYHSCCINVVRVEEEETKNVWIQDPNTQTESMCTYDEFVSEYRSLDICHKIENLDNLSHLYGRNISNCSWTERKFPLQFNNNTDEYTITLTDPDDDEEGCTFILELIQNIKPSAGEEPKHINPWKTCVDLELQVGGNSYNTPFPQETYCFTLQPDTYDIKITTETEEHSEILMRIFYKKEYSVDRK